MGAAPSGVDGQIKTSPILLKDQSSGAPARANVPGVYYIPQSGVAPLLGHMSKHSGAGVLADRWLFAVHMGSSFAATSAEGVSLIDLTGPWR